MTCTSGYFARIDPSRSAFSRIALPRKPGAGAPVDPETVRKPSQLYLAAEVPARMHELPAELERGFRKLDRGG